MRAYTITSAAKNDDYFTLEAWSAMNVVFKLKSADCLGMINSNEVKALYRKVTILNDL